MERYQQKLAELEQEIEQNPEDVRTLAHRGETYRLLKRYEEALADFDRAIELQPEYYWAIAHRGEVYYQKEEYEKALADFNRALELQPDYLWATAHRGVTYEYMKRFEEALADLNWAIQHKPNYAWAFAHRGRTYEQMKQYEKALEDFDKTIALDETVIPHWYSERGLLLSFMRRYAESIEYYEQALKENPDDYFSLYSKVVVKTHWKGLVQTQAAINEVRTILLSVVNSSGNSDAFYGLGGLAALEGKTDEALNYLQKAISLDSDRRETVLHDLAWLNLTDPRLQALISESTK